MRTAKYPELIGRIGHECGGYPLSKIDCLARYGMTFRNQSTQNAYNVGHWVNEELSCHYQYSKFCCDSYSSCSKS
jgi:hypothetical protein